jgi:hypothetical protein
MNWTDYIGTLPMHCASRLHAECSIGFNRCTLCDTIIFPDQDSAFAR